jgi:hypothetical protein
MADSGVSQIREGKNSVSVSAPVFFLGRLADGSGTRIRDQHTVSKWRATTGIKTRVGACDAGIQPPSKDILLNFPISLVRKKFLEPL